MKNIYYLVLTILTGGTAAGLILANIDLGDGVLISFLIFYIWLYNRGTFKYSVWNRVFFISISILILGLLARLQHWSFSNLLIIFAGSLIALAYSIFFIRKRNKQTLDFFKWVLVIMFWFGNYSVFNQLGYTPGYYFYIFTLFINFITLVLFIAELSRTPGWLYLSGTPVEDPYNLKEFLSDFKKHDKEV